MDKPLIQIKNIVKKYGDRIVFDNVSLDIMKGESIALIGNNGMGKSTLIKILCGLKSINSGEIIRDKNLKFNYIPEKFESLNIKAEEYIKLIGELEHISKDEFIEKTNYLYRKFNLDKMINTSMKNLSKGTLQKIAVVQAFLSKPDVLLLDEPLSGQDIQSQRVFIHIVKELIKDGVTVVMSCHELDLINQLSTRILRVEDSKLHEIKKEDINLEQYSSIAFLKRKTNRSEIIKNIDGVHDYSEDEECIKFKIEVNKSNRVLTEMINSGYTLKYFER